MIAVPRRRLSETGDPYLPDGYDGPVGTCGFCGNEAPLAPVACPSDACPVPSPHPMCEPCRVGFSEVHGVPAPRPRELYRMPAGSGVKAHATPPTSKIALCGAWTGRPPLPASAPFDRDAPSACGSCSRLAG